MSMKSIFQLLEKKSSIEMFIKHKSLLDALDNKHAANKLLEQKNAEFLKLIKHCDSFSQFNFALGHVMAAKYVSDLYLTIQVQNRLVEKENAEYILALNAAKQALSFMHKVKHKHKHIKVINKEKQDALLELQQPRDWLKKVSINDFNDKIT